MEESTPLEHPALCQAVCDYDDNCDKNVYFCSSLIPISINIIVMIGRTIKMWKTIRMLAFALQQPASKP